jgi:hypothetical protein
MRSVALGFGTIFQPKAKADDHWSTLPQVTLVVAAPGAFAGEPRGDSGVVAA